MQGYGAFSEAQTGFVTHIIEIKLHVFCRLHHYIVVYSITNCLFECGDELVDLRLNIK